ncbi:MAG: hypothetical protein KME31_18550 [Tolypothrix carrinoi HA7290-LM1]|nr:hypothetical protein [Tolypothrix carrinoi HA7290-LM1]
MGHGAWGSQCVRSKDLKHSRVMATGKRIITHYPFPMPIASVPNAH